MSELSNGEPRNDLSEREAAHAEQLLSVTAHSEPSGVVTVTAAGEIDMATGPLLQARLDEQLQTEPRHLVLDLTQVTFLGSAGLSAAVVAQRQAEQSGTDLYIVAPTHVTRRPIEATGLEEVLTLFSDLPAALAAARAR